MADNARKKMSADLKSILDTGKYSDFIITCKGDTYNVHKAVVCTRSGFFERAERFPAGKEHENGKVDLPADEPAIVKILVNYLYEAEYEPKLPDGVSSKDDTSPVMHAAKDSRFNYHFPHTCMPKCPRPWHMVCPHHECTPETCGEQCVSFICRQCCPEQIRPSPPGNAAQMLVHAKMYEAGDKYDVAGLKELSHEKFLRTCCKYWNDEHFAPAAYHALTTTHEADMGLRDIIKKVIAQHIELLNKPEVIALLHEFNGLATGILELRAKDLGWIKTA